MSVDDQLFKRDGNPITDLDILLLKFSGFVAKFFLDEEEETYSPAIYRMSCLGGFLSLVSAGSSFWQGKILDGVITTIFAAAMVFIGSRKTCSAVGTLIPLGEKIWNLFIFFWPICFGIGNVVEFIGTRDPAVLSLFVWELGFSVWIMAVDFVSRLDKPKRKTKRARVWQTAHNPAA